MRYDSAILCRSNIWSFVMHHRSDLECLSRQYFTPLFLQACVIIWPRRSCKACVQATR